MPDRDVFIISAVRTPIGLGNSAGALQSFQPVDLAAAVLKEVVRRAGIDAGRVEDVILGVGNQGGNLARLAALKAGFPVNVPGVEINRTGASGQQAVHFGAQAILAGDADILIVGGVEMMSHQLQGGDYPRELPETGFKLIAPGESAGLLDSKWALSRDELDDYAYQSHVRAGRAIKNGYFDSQILTLDLPDGRQLRADEGVNQLPDRAWLAQLKPLSGPGGVTTMGNSSQGSDGAAALLLASAQAVGKYNLMPMARIESRVVVGSDPTLMPDGAAAAILMALNRSGLTLEEMGVIEINETFAALVLAEARKLGADMSRVNPNGGAIAHGDPLGASGAILMTKLVNELERQRVRFGLQSMTTVQGMSIATIIERV